METSDFKESVTITATIDNCVRVIRPSHWDKNIYMG